MRDLGARNGENVEVEREIATQRWPLHTARDSLANIGSALRMLASPARRPSSRGKVHLPWTARLEAPFL